MQAPVFIQAAAWLAVLAAAPQAWAQAAAPSNAAAMLGQPAGLAELERARGGNAAMDAGASLRGTVGSNTAINVVTGANTIGQGSFAGASGIPIVIQNTGANVLIQNATVIQLQLH